MGGSTTRRHRLYKTVWPGETIVFGYNSTRPVDFMVILGCGPAWGDECPRGTEALVNATGSTVYFGY